MPARSTRIALSTRAVGDTVEVRFLGRTIALQPADARRFVHQIAASTARAEHARDAAAIALQGAAMKVI